MLNKNAGYGNLVAGGLIPATAGKTFFVTAAIGTGAQAQTLQDIFTPDDDGVVRVYSTLTLALAATVAGRGDAIILASDYTTAPTDTELSAAATNGVQIIEQAKPIANEFLVSGTNKALPATTTGAIFTVTGVVEIVSIIGLVTTVIQTQACNCKISTVSNAATTDICANLDITGKLAQSRMSITGTFANAMLNTAKGVPVARQATPVVVQEGTIILTTDATNTGNIRWSVLYRPLQAGSKVVAA